MTQDDLLAVILDDVRQIKEEIRVHARDEMHDFKEVRAQIAELHTRMEVNRGRISLIVTMLSATVATAVGLAGQALGGW